MRPTRFTFNSTQSTFNPLKVDELIAKALLPTLQKYKAEFFDYQSDNSLSAPAVAISVVERSRSTAHPGTNMPNYMKASDLDYGIAREYYGSVYKIILKVYVVGNTPSQTKDMAWDIETLLENLTAGIIDNHEGQDKVLQGFDIKFLNQMEDKNVNSQNSEVIAKVLRFEVHLPVLFTQDVPKVTSLDIGLMTGKILYTNVTFTRTSTSTTFEIPVPGPSRFVTSIFNIYRKIGNEYVELIPSIDYRLVSNSTSNWSVYIEWLDSQGSTPNVDEEFYLDYIISERMKTLDSPYTQS